MALLYISALIFAGVATAATPIFEPGSHGTTDPPKSLTHVANDDTVVNQTFDHTKPNSIAECDNCMVADTSLGSYRSVTNALGSYDLLNTMTAPKLSAVSGGNGYSLA